MLCRLKLPQESFFPSLAFCSKRSLALSYRYIIIGKDKRISSGERASKCREIYELNWNGIYTVGQVGGGPPVRGGKGRQRRASMDCRFPTTIIMCIARAGGGRGKEEKRKKNNNKRREKRGIAGREGKEVRGEERGKKRCEKNGDSRYNVRCLDALYYLRDTPRTYLKLP